MRYEEVSKSFFYLAVDAIQYRPQDIKEAYDFGCDNIKACYDKSKHKFAKYFLVYDSVNRPVVTVMLQRDGHIIFFIDKNIDEPIKLIRVLKALADETVANAGPIITKTAYWYTEAQRMNKLIGFKDMTLYDYHGLYVKE